MKTSSRSIRRVLGMAAVAVLIGTPSSAYFHYIHFSSRSGPFTPIYEKFDLSALTNKTVTFFVSDQSPTSFAPNDNFGSVLSQVKQALAVWNGVGSSDLRIAFGGLESYTANPASTNAGGPVPAAASPGGDIIFIDLPPGVIGLGAPATSKTPVNIPNASFFPITRGVVMLSRDTTASAAGPSYLEEFFTTAVHEIGHALGLQHTWTGSAMSQGVIRNTSRARPLDADDIAGLSVLYGKPGWAAGFGSVSGKVTLNNQGVYLASVVAIAPTGPAVSTLTYPDGTYRIDGLPPNQSYQVYVHPLPPDAVVPNGEGLKLPVDQNGIAIQPSSTIFQTNFAPGTLDPGQATSYIVGNGTSIQNLNFAVQRVLSLPTYDVVTYARLNTATRTYTPYGAAADVVTVVGYSAFVDISQSPGLVIAQAAAPASLPNPNSMTILGGFAPALLNPPPPTAATILPYPDNSGAVAAYFYPPSGVTTGPRHLVFNFGGDIYVLPNAITLVQKGPPLISNVANNLDNSVTVTGAGFGSDSAVYFDGLKATVQTAFSGNDQQGSITVIPPPGIAGQVAVVTVYNSDGQNSMILQSQNPPTYTYPGAPAPQISNVSYSALPAASSAAVDITASNTSFQDGHVTVGFGSSDVVVRRVWVKDATHLTANVQVVSGATLGASEISVVSGLQVISQPAAFQIQAARLQFPYIYLPAVNADPTQQTIYPGSIASIYGVNLATSPGGTQLKLNDVAVQLQQGGVSPTQINFYIPLGFPTGPAVLKLNNGTQDAFPVIVQIDNAPPTILSLNGQAVNAPATSMGIGDMISVIVTGLDPTVLNNLSRVQIGINGILAPVLNITALPNNQHQIQFLESQSFGGASVPLVVWVDGSSSAPINITIR